MPAGKETGLYAWRRANVAALNRLARESMAAEGWLSGPELHAPGGARYAAGDMIVTLAPGAQATRPAARPASEQVPATAQAVTISMDLGGNQGGKRPPKPVTITDQARVSELKALINGLALFPPGAFSCPADFGDDLLLTFRAGPGSPALAVATVALAGCDGVDLTINGKSQPALAGPGTDNGPRILKTAGLSWKIPAY